MSEYRTEEEQLEAIKQWWGRHQRWIMIVFTTVLLCVSGYRYWSWHTARVQKEASFTYDRMIAAYSRQEDQDVLANATQLVDTYSNTVYSDVAHLMLARVEVKQKEFDLARQNLSYVATHSTMPALRELANVRLARILISENSYAKAQVCLNQIKSATYEPLVKALKGDILRANGEFAHARQLYQEARLVLTNLGLQHSLLSLKMIENE